MITAVSLLSSPSFFTRESSDPHLNSIRIKKQISLDYDQIYLSKENINRESTEIFTSLKNSNSHAKHTVQEISVSYSEMVSDEEKTKKMLKFLRTFKQKLQRKTAMLTRKA